MSSCPTCGRAMLTEYPHNHSTAIADALGLPQVALPATPPASETVEAFTPAQVERWRAQLVGRTVDPDLTWRDREVIELVARFVATIDAIRAESDGQTLQESLSRTIEAAYQRGRAESDERVRALREAAADLLRHAETDDDFDGQYIEWMVPDASIEALRAVLDAAPEDAP